MCLFTAHATCCASKSPITQLVERCYSASLFCTDKEWGRGGEGTVAWFYTFCSSLFYPISLTTDAFRCAWIASARMSASSVCTSALESAMDAGWVRRIYGRNMSSWIRPRWCLHLATVWPTGQNEDTQRCICLPVWELRQMLQFCTIDVHCPTEVLINPT